MTDIVVETTSLSKEFRAGVRAVDDLSFTVERGQVCGLLGPNGAGKTTCLRIVLGLVRPTSGSAQLFGEPARPGSDMLKRVGAMVEEAAFVPHLSGMKNLELWWREGGGRLADADFEHALGIAELGNAISRKVKTYSQGMKQRLGLARVLLSRPELLLLDEPTNGLDPGEIREFRLLVHRLVDAGSTVLVSSHLLSEVEQICTHAVVMDKGRLIAAGSVTALIGTAGSVYFEVDNVERATQILGQLPGVRSVSSEPPGLAVDLLDGAQRSELVAALVRGEVGVETVMMRRRLEDAFLGLVEAGA
jgi:ABC-2 type transport system ATP-binding protein